MSQMSDIMSGVLSERAEETHDDPNSVNQIKSKLINGIVTKVKGKQKPLMD